MKILFLTKYPESQASSRYCVYQYLDYFRNEGIELDVEPFYSESTYRTIFGKRFFGLKLLAFLACVIFRLRWLFRLGNYDLVVSHRECIPIGPPWFERIVRWRGKPFVLIYDDALFLFKKSPTSRIFDWFKNPDRYLKLFRLASITIGTNDYLANVPTEYGGQGRKLKIGEDTRKYKPLGIYKRTPITIGWVGSGSTEKYLEIIREPLEKLGKKHGDSIQLTIVGGGSFSLDHLAVVQHQWSFDEEVELLQSIDIGIMPLPDDEWSLGKSGGKARLYMACGIVPVATGIGFNSELIQHRLNGILISNIDDWYSSLEELIVDTSLRRQLSEAARIKIKEELSIDVTGKEYLRLLNDAIHLESN
ncbi:MAG: glycosyltransferase family 4 protein [Planctomycetota bacterium]